MTELAILLPLAAFVALAAGFAIVLRRAGLIVARKRELEGFRHAVNDLAGRVDTSLGSAADRIDAMRRQQVSADSITSTIAAASDALTRYTDEAKALHGPPAALEVKADLLSELDRASRALEMVDHGATILDGSRRRGRDLEAQTAIKRGYLNLLHAREALAAHAARADALRVLPEADPSHAPIGVRK